MLSFFSSSGGVITLLRRGIYLFFLFTLTVIGGCSGSDVLLKSVPVSMRFGFSLPNVSEESKSFNALNDTSSDSILSVLNVRFAASGSTAHNNINLDLTYKSEQDIYYSSDYNISSGSYTIDRFTAWNASGEIVYGTPIEGNEYTDLVSTPLTYNFDVTSDSNDIVLEVVSIEDVGDISDFGYQRFGVEIQATMDVQILLVEGNDAYLNVYNSVNGEVEVDGDALNGTLITDISSLGSVVRLPNNADEVYNFVFSSGVASIVVSKTTDELRHYSQEYDNGIWVIAMGDTNAQSDITDFTVLAGENPRELVFNWTDKDAFGVGHYELQVNSDGDSGFVTELNITDVNDNSVSLIISVYDTDFINTRYRLNAIDVNGEYISSSNEVGLLNNVTARQIIGYFKGSHTAPEAKFSQSISLSDDGHILAVGSGTAFIFGVVSTNNDNAGNDTGAVYVFEYIDSNWQQTAYLKAHNAASEDKFGRSLALSGDGSTLVIGAPGEDSNGSAYPEDNSVLNAGAVYVFEKDNDDEWNQKSYLKPINIGIGDDFGRSVKVNNDGDVLVVGAPFEDGSGAVYVFTRNDDNWKQSAYLKAHNPGVGDRFGWATALDDAGVTVAVGSQLEDSISSDDPGDNSATNAGAVYVFKNVGNIWEQKKYLKPNDLATGDHFGWSIALNSDATMMAVNSMYDDVVGRETGAVYIFEDDGTGSNWNQNTILVPSNSESYDFFGVSVAMNHEGDTLAVGAYTEDAKNRDNASDNSVGSAGAAYVFRYSGVSWDEISYLKANETDVEDYFGWTLDLSGDGNTLAVGALLEDGNATGISTDLTDPDAQINNSVSNAGAVYLY